MHAEALKQKKLLPLIIYGARPKTLVASFFPVILGMLIARMDGFYDIITYLCTLFTAAFIQIGTNYANDFFDSKAGRDTDKRLGPARIGSLGLLSKNALMILTIVSFSLAALLSTHLISVGGSIILYLMALAFCLGIFYSCGKYSLANTGLSNLTVFLVFGPLATMMTYFLQTHSYEPKAAFFGILPGCFSLMLLSMNNLRDMQEDGANEKKTLVVRFGFEWGKKEYSAAFFMGISIIPLSIMLYNAPVFTCLPLLMLGKGFGLIKKVSAAKEPKEIIPLFEETAKFILLFALIYITAWRIVEAL